MYNQPTQVLPNGRTVGLLYKNPFDCLWKTLQTEGPFGWYKGECSTFVLPTTTIDFICAGSTAHFLRIAPHTIVTLTANEFIIRLYRRIRDGPVVPDDA